MLEIRLIMNSTAEDILSFKTCCGLKLFDQNLEIQLINQGRVPVVVPSCFDLETSEGVQRFDHLIPSGNLRIEPGEIKAFYCSMDESLWQKSRGLVFYDQEGNRYPVPISIIGLKIDTTS